MTQRHLFKSRLATALTGSALLMLCAQSAFAIGGLGDIVYDPSNYLQAVKQVQAWEQQYSQMEQSLAEAQATLTQIKSGTDAMTGSRGLGGIFDNPALKSIIPQDLSKTLASLNATGTLSGEAQTIRSSNLVYNCTDIEGTQQKSNCQAILGQASQAQAVQQNTMALLNERTTQIDALRDQINATQDPKAIAELQARLDAEAAQTANDQNKIVMANAMLATSQQAAVQAERERVNALMATNKTSSFDGFSFAALGTVTSPQQVATVQ